MFYIFVCMYAYICVCMYIYLYVYVYMYVYTYICMYVYIFSWAYWQRGEVATYIYVYVSCAHHGNVRCSWADWQCGEVDILKSQLATRITMANTHKASFRESLPHQLRIPRNTQAHTHTHAHTHTYTQTCWHCVIRVYQRCGRYTTTT